MSSVDDCQCFARLLCFAQFGDSQWLVSYMCRVGSWRTKRRWNIQLFWWKRYIHKILWKLSHNLWIIHNNFKILFPQVTRCRFTESETIWSYDMCRKCKLYHVAEIILRRHSRNWRSSTIIRCHCWKNVHCMAWWSLDGLSVKFSDTKPYYAVGL